MCIKIRKLYLLKHIQLQHPGRGYNYDSPNRLKNSWWNIARSQNSWRYLTISVQFQEKPGLLEELEGYTYNQADDIKPWHHLYPNYRHRLFPIAHHGKLPHDQYHLHWMVHVNDRLLVSLQKIDATSVWTTRIEGNFGRSEFFGDLIKSVPIIGVR